MAMTTAPDPTMADGRFTRGAGAVESSADIGAPSVLTLPLETRAGAEWGSHIAMLAFLRLLRSGDGHHVLVLPGFLASDFETRPLRRALRHVGYQAHGWGQGRNYGPTVKAIDGAMERAAEVADVAGGKVSLIGWSLGGVYARELARIRPDIVRQVITLASPFRLAGYFDADTKLPANIPSAIQHMKSHEFHSLVGAIEPEELRPPLPVPSTAIYSKTDAVVHWRSCLNIPGPESESVQVRSSHCGIVARPGVFRVIADRLAQPESEWRPYERPTGLTLRRCR